MGDQYIYHDIAFTKDAIDRPILTEQSMTALKEYYVESLLEERLGTEQPSLKYGKFLEWLDNETDFYYAPFTASNHFAFPGGLLLHTILTFNAAQDLVNGFYGQKDSTVLLENEVEGSVELSCLLHSLWKINTYHPVEKWVKNASTGNQWVSYIGYERKPNTFSGKGAKSIITAQKFFPLSDMQEEAIYWHMGEFDVNHTSWEEKSDLTAVYEKNITAFIVNQAYLLAQHVYPKRIFSNVAH